MKAVLLKTAAFTAAAALVASASGWIGTFAQAQSMLTAPENCVGPTLQIQDSTDVAILCDGLVVEKAPFNGIATLEVGIKAASLVMKALVSDTLTTFGNATETVYEGAKKTLEFDAGFSELRTLTSLTFKNVQFKAPNVSIKTPDSLLTLTIDSTNAEDLLLTVLPGSSPKLQLLDLTGNAFSAIPKCLYNRQYPANSLKANVEVLRKTFEVLDHASFEMLSSNLAPTQSSFELSSGCNFDTGFVGSAATGNRITKGVYKVCDASTVTGTVPSRDASSGSTSTPAPQATTSASSGSGSSDTTLIVLVVIIAVVALALGCYLFHRHFLNKKMSLDPINDNAINLIGKVDTATSGKQALLSNDETLSGIRLDHPVSLTRPAGSGRTWVGEYLREKVIVKRVEAEITDTYVTKSLMNQACFLAPLSHPNIVSLKGVTWVAGTDFAIVAEFMDKDNLRTVLSDPEIELDMEAKLGMCLEIARALVYLHNAERNMYVRNLSSRKVLVKGANECKINLFDCYPCVKKITPVENYGAGELVWLAPEIIMRSFPVDPKKANIYAFGVLMCEILSRVSPFQNLIDEVGNTLSDIEIAKRVRQKDTIAPHENHPEYMWAPQSLRTTIELCLSISPAERPTAEDIIIALQDAKVEEIAASLRTGGDFFV